MRVEIELLEDAVAVTRTDTSGGSMSGRTHVVRPGESWRGYKYRRLRRLGDGTHELLSRRQLTDLARMEKG